MRRFALTRRDEWRRRQPLLSGLQRNSVANGVSGVDRADRLRDIVAFRGRWRERHRTGCQASLASMR